MAASTAQEHPTPGQLALVHVAKARLGLEESEYRDLLKATAGVRSARELDSEGFSAVMERLAQLGFRARKRPPIPRRPGMATSAQIDYIQGLWRRFTGRGDLRGLDTWLRHRFGISSTRQLDRAIAHQTLVALKAMVGRKSRSSPPAGNGPPALWGVGQK